MKEHLFSKSLVDLQLAKLLVPFSGRLQSGAVGKIKVHEYLKNDIRRKRLYFRVYRRILERVWVLWR